ncbi:unnamed protein product, partial [Mesorhabditis belari]|uniref:Uncharacterized protein n=1 Tax=Mesorhabditis belari TaxID=2138241 RepID=A0AAF3FLI8_9BILA
MSSPNATLPQQFVSFSDNFLEILIMGLVSTLGTIFGLVAMIVVYRNLFLTGIVRHYILIDVFSLFSMSFVYLIWGVPSGIWHFNESFPVIENLLGSVAYAVTASAYNARVLLGVNRFFALAFEGRFFFPFERLNHLQYFVLIVYSLLNFISSFRHGHECPHNDRFSGVQVLEQTPALIVCKISRRHHCHARMQLALKNFKINVVDRSDFNIYQQQSPNLDTYFETVMDRPVFNNCRAIVAYSDHFRYKALSKTKAISMSNTNLN